MDYNSIPAIQRLLTEKNLSPQKQFGQNFMVNEGARRDIVALLNPKQGDLIWEIGPGLGALTSEILKHTSRVRAFEIDRGYIPILKESFGQVEGFQITEGDALKLWPSLRDEKPSGILGNLPYNVATGLITDFLERGLWTPMVFTVQKEVGQRMRAKPGDDNYGSLSVFCQAIMDITMPLQLRPGSFYPVPNVVSAVVLLKPRAKPLDFGSSDSLNKVLRCLFSMRRKTLLNNIKQSSDPRLAGLTDIVQSMKIDLGRRAETLTVEEFCQISKTVDASII